MEVKKMKKMNYTIVISLREESMLRFTARMPYYRSTGQTDCVTFGGLEITIVAERNRVYDEQAIFMNVQNSLYNQMLKCLMIHYCYEGANAGITQITVHVEGLAVQDYVRTFDGFQPFAVVAPSVPFNVVTLQQLLLEDNASFKLRMIIAHWLTQGYASDRQRKLECVWRTFEQLCEHVRHAAPRARSNVTAGIDKMVKELTNNPARYPQSAAVVSGETQASLRSLRWHDMIENNYPETLHGGCATTYDHYRKRMTVPYTDERVCLLMKDVLPYRKRELQYYSLYSRIETDLNAKIALHQTKDIDVVALLCYYAYYLRNRLFHGQTLVRGSVFDSQRGDEMRIEFLTKMLNTLTVELINNYGAL